MIRRVLFTVFTITLLIASAYANNSPLDVYIQNLNSGGVDYVAGKISSEELLCKIIETEYLMNRDKSAIEFVFSKGKSEIKKMYGVTLNESDWRYGDENDVKKDVRDQLIGTTLTSIQLSTFYNLQGDRPVVIYLAMHEDESNKYNMIWVDIYPTPYRRRTNEGYGFEQKCLEKYLKPRALVALENATQAVASAKKSGIDTAGAEERLENSKDLFEKGNYWDSQRHAEWSIEIVESAKKLSEYRSLSDEEKTRLIQSMFSNFPKEKNNISEAVSEEAIKNSASLGLNTQFNVFLGDESNSLFSFTEVIDINNKTKTTYQNQLIGEYDLYVGIDAKFWYELGLMGELMFMGESNPNPFNFDNGKRIGIALVKGEIKIKPIWKFYKILSMLRELGGASQEFVKGVTSEIT